MFKELFFFFIFILIASTCLAQPKIDEGFETSDSLNLPSGWSKWNNAGYQIDPFANWTVRDSGSAAPGIPSYTTVSHTGLKSCGVTWETGYDTLLTTFNVTDAWLVTKRVINITANDVLKFWATGGTITWYDSLQIWISFVDSTPASFTIKLGDIYYPSGSIYGEWSEYTYSLAPYASTPIMWVGFRYNMDVNNAGHMVQLDDVFLGEQSAVQQIGNNIPDKFALSQNYPNPFNPSTTIRFDLAKSTDVTLIVYNSIGQEVARIFEGHQKAGSYEATFDAGKLSSGTYYYRLTTDSFVETKKMVVVK